MDTQDRGRGCSCSGWSCDHWDLGQSAFLLEGMCWLSNSPLPATPVMFVNSSPTQRDVGLHDGTRAGLLPEQPGYPWAATLQPSSSWPFASVPQRPAPCFPEERKDQEAASWGLIRIPGLGYKRPGHLVPPAMPQPRPVAPELLLPAALPLWAESQKVTQSHRKPSEDLLRARMPEALKLFVHLEQPDSPP